MHSIGAVGDFADVDRQAATNFAQAAGGEGVRRIIYLGGLGNPDETLSKRLRSRQETGDLLRKHHPQVVEFRASIVIGSGSLSFEMLRALVERLPVMICPRWVRVQAQPIAVEDLLSYLLEAIDLPDGPSQIYEVGGPEQVSYGQIMHEYARQRGLGGRIIPVPLLTPYLSRPVAPDWSPRCTLESGGNWSKVSVTRRSFRTTWPPERFPFSRGRFARRWPAPW